MKAVMRDWFKLRVVELQPISCWDYGKIRAWALWIPAKAQRLKQSFTAVPDNLMTTFLSNRDIYEAVVCGIVPQVRERLQVGRMLISSPYFGLLCD